MKYRILLASLTMIFSFQAKADIWVNCKGKTQDGALVEVNLKNTTKNGKAVSGHAGQLYTVELKEKEKQVYQTSVAIYSLQSRSFYSASTFSLTQGMDKSDSEWNLYLHQYSESGATIGPIYNTISVRCTQAAHVWYN